MDISAILTDRATTATQTANNDIQMCVNINWIESYTYVCFKGRIAPLPDKLNPYLQSTTYVFINKTFFCLKCIISGLVCHHP